MILKIYPTVAVVSITLMVAWAYGVTNEVDSGCATQSLVSCISCVGSNSYEFEISGDVIGRTPKWLPSKHSDPPLGSGEALEIARLQLGLYVGDEHEYEVSHIILNRFFLSDWWFYGVTFRKRYDVSTGINMGSNGDERVSLSDSIEIVVLMNRQVVKGKKRILPMDDAGRKLKE